MKQYLSLCNEILQNGESKSDRTNTGTKSIFGIQRRYDLRDGFPLVTTKKVNFNLIIHELLWFIKGDTNIKYLVDNGISIWNEWPYKKFKNSSAFNGETIDEFISKIKNSNAFSAKWGNLGPVYGKQWRDFSGIDQLKELIAGIKSNPNSRRHILSSWNPAEIKSMLLPPCHTLFQFYVSEDGYLSCQLYQRSADIFLGVPFNIASYSLLIMLIAQVTNLKPGEFIHTMGDAHIYLNHLEQINLQLKRKPYHLPKVKINKKIKSIFDFTIRDIKLVDYKHYPPIKGKVAV